MKHASCSILTKGYQIVKIEQLVTKDTGFRFQGIYLFVQPELKETRNGKYFLSTQIKDNSGALPGICWEISDLNLYQHYLQKYEAFEISARVDEYRDSKQIVIESITPIDEITPLISQNLVKSIDPEESEAYLKIIHELAEKCSNTHCRELMAMLLGNTKFMSRFTSAAAAVRVHHAYQGGLLKHTSFVMQEAIALYERYKPMFPELNADVIILGSFFHDLGKMNEYRNGMTIRMSDEGQLIGHMYDSTEFFGQAAQQVEGFPKEIEIAVKHCILSHHGQTEWGAVVVPKTTEAVIVSLADYADSKIMQFIETVGAIEMGEWSKYNQFLSGCLFSSKYEQLETKGLLEEVFENNEPEKNEILKKSKEKTKKNEPDNHLQSSSLF